MSSEINTPGGAVAPSSNDNGSNKTSHDDHPLKVTFFKELASTKPGALKNTTWGKLVTAFQGAKSAPADKHELSLWCPTVFEGNRRKGELAEEVFLFAVDIDNEIKPVEHKKLKNPPPTRLVTKAGKETYKLDPVNTIDQVLAVMPGVECFWHTSFSHTPEWPKYRVAWLFKRPVTPTEYKTLWERLEARFSAAGVFIDPATKNVSRAWFVPARTEHFGFGRVEGETLDPDVVLDEAAPADDATTEPPEQKPKTEEKAFRFLRFVLDQYSFVRSPTGRVFASRGGLLMPVDGDGFASKVAHAFRFVTGGNVVSKDAIDKEMLATRGGDLPIVDAPIRFAQHQGKIYVDLGDRAGRVIEIGKYGSHVLEQSPVAFYRPSSLRPLPTPIFPSDPEEALAALEPFKNLLVVDRPSWVACLAFLVQAMRPSRVYSILICKGPKGIGKTTRARLLRRVIDPRRPEVTGLPKTKDDLCIQAENAHVLVFDNLRYLDHEMSDALCRLATGDGQEKRALYTDRDLVAFEAARPVILTSISDAATEPDILDRSLIVKFERPEHRRTDDDIDQEFAAIHPRVLGALCFAASLGLDLWPGFEVPSDIRMQVPCRFACGMESHLLQEGEVVAAYRDSNEQALATASEDSFVVGFLKWNKVNTTWGGTAAELLDALTEHAKGGDDRSRTPKWIPRTPRGVRSKLDMFRDLLRDHGITITYGTTGRGDEKRGSIQIESGVGGVHLENDASDNAPRESSGNQAVGVRGVDGAGCSEILCREPGEAVTDRLTGVRGTSDSPPGTFLKKTHPTHPTHPNASNQGGSSGVRRDSNAPQRTPDPPQSNEPPDFDDDEFNQRLMSI